MDTSILTRQIGPLPGWAWGGLVAFGAWFFFLRGKTGTSSTGTANAAASGSQLSSGYGLGYAQGLQAASANQPPAAATASGQPAVFTGAGTLSLTGNQSGTSAIRSAPDSRAPVVTQAPVGTKITVNPTGSPDPNSQFGQWYQVVSGPGAGSWAWGPDISLQAAVGGALAGIGGAVRKHAIGSRAAAPVWHDAHPLVGAPVRYAHYVRAVGGPGNHRREVARVAQQAGVHPARIAMLNPHYTGRIRIA